MSTPSPEHPDRPIYRLDPRVYLLLLGNMVFVAVVGIAVIVTLIVFHRPTESIQPVAVSAPSQAPKPDIAPVASVARPASATTPAPTRESPVAAVASEPPPRPVPQPAPLPSPPAAVLPPPRPSGTLVAQQAPSRYRQGEAFDQEVTVSRRSSFRVLGADVGQAAEYAFTSRLTIDAVGPDGTLTVGQTITAARLVDCDPATRGTLQDALKKAEGAKFRITVGPGGEVTAMTGPKDPVRVAAGNDPLGRQTFRVWSLLDADGWKELAGLTFFHPGRPLRAGEVWHRPLAHDWGPLGSWAGQTKYVAGGRKGGLDRIDYAHQMSYRPPARGAESGLPFQMTKADFRPVAAGGAILFDPARERTTAAEETFQVRGGVAVSVAGSDAVVEMEEWQNFRLRITDPATRTLTGRPLPARK